MNQLTAAILAQFVFSVAAVAWIWGCFAFGYYVWGPISLKIDAWQYERRRRVFLQSKTAPPPEGDEAE